MLGEGYIQSYSPVDLLLDFAIRTTVQQDDDGDYDGCIKYNRVKYVFGNMCNQGILSMAMSCTGSKNQKKCQRR